MTSLVLYPDIPCAYPDSLGEAIVTGVGNTPVPIAVFRNLSSVSNLRAILQRFDFLPSNPSGDTAVVIQMMPSVDVTGGTWTAIAGSELEINTTATSVSGSRAALTLYAQATASHGNTPASGGLAGADAQALGLELNYNMTFALFAKTIATGITVDLLWSVNWLEKD